MSEELKDNKEVEEINKDEKNNKVKSIISWSITIIVCLVIAKLFTTFVVRSVEVDGYSMSTTLSDGDKALTDALFYKLGGIDRFDIVIVKKEDGMLKGQEIVKRVIALPGETFEYKDGVLYINEEVVEQDFITDVVKELTPNMSKRTLGDDEYIILGDNRANSTDSSEFGAIKKSEIKGRGLLRFMVCSAKDENNECSKRKFVWPSSVK